MSSNYSVAREASDEERKIVQTIYKYEPIEQTIINKNKTVNTITITVMIVGLLLVIGLRVSGAFAMMSKPAIVVTCVLVLIVELCLGVLTHVSGHVYYGLKGKKEVFEEDEILITPGFLGHPTPAPLAGMLSFPVVDGAGVEISSKSYSFSDGGSATEGAPVYIICPTLGETKCVLQTEWNKAIPSLREDNNE